MDKLPDQEVSRRQLLRIGLTAGAASFVIGGLEVTFPRKRARSPQ